MSRTWFITGTSSGFGRQLTEQLLARGDTVAATARRTETLDDLAARYGDRLWRARLDVTDTAVMREVVAQAFADLGRIDVVVEEAGSRGRDVGTEFVVTAHASERTAGGWCWCWC